jgi:site-specific recombinase XerD
VAHTSIAQYEAVVADFIAALGAVPASYTAESIRGFIVERAPGHGTPRAQSITTAVRSFLRFLAATGQCSEDLLHAVPRLANWRLASTPRFLEPEDVERVIGACSDEDALGARDRAVILLLARLGLRAGEVAGLTFDDIDWKNGRIAVCGKGRRQEWLPLPQEIGDAITVYLRRGRAPLQVPRVFTTVLAPRHPMTRAAVTHVVRSALRRAGVKAPVNGAHVLRHSAATAMLRSGASLAGVAAVLRHRSPSTTAHYAKVDFGLLAEVAQPWPEVPSC